jgi:chromosome segregation ATPase
MAKNSKKNKNKANGQAKFKTPEVAQPAATEVVENPESLSVDQPESVQVPDCEQSDNNRNNDEKVSEPVKEDSNEEATSSAEDNTKLLLLENKLKDLEAQLAVRNSEVDMFKTRSLEHEAALQSLQENHKRELSQLESKIAESATKNSKHSDDNNSDEKYAQQINDLKAKLEAALKDKANSDQQYQNLVSRVSTIKATLGERLKTDAAELVRNKEIIQSLEEEKKSMTTSLETLKKELIFSIQENENLSKELSAMRLEYQSSIENWDSKYDSLVKENRMVQEESEKASNLAKSLEVSLSEEKTLRVNLESKKNDLEEQIKIQINYAEQYRRERDDVKSEKIKLAEQVETLSKFNADKTKALLLEINILQEELEKTKEKLEQSVTQVAELQKSNADIPELEKEVKEKNLQLGKLRHEAVTLNEHLTRALRMIQKTSQGDTVDKQLVTNMLLSFLSLPRADTKRFEVLNLISNYLGWNDDQNIQAGLSRSGATPGKSPLSPRTRSEESSGGFMSMFADFLERESSKSGK